MTAEQFKKYEGKRTTGRVYGNDLSGGIIVGYTNDSFPNELLAINSNSGWTGPHWSNEAIIPNKEYENDYLSGLKNYLWVTVDDVIMEEEKELDLTQILEGCEGVELWSDLFGECKLEKIDEDSSYEVKVLVKSENSHDSDTYESFTKEGKFYNYKYGKCMLWPSETCRDWSTFKKPVKVNDDDWFACTDGNGVYTVIKYGNISESWKYIIPYDKFRPDLTEEDLKKLSIV